VVFKIDYELDQDEVDALVLSAWDTEEDRLVYVEALKLQSNAFEGVEEVLVEADDPPNPNPDPIEPEGLNIAVIVGAGIGGGALLILLAFMILRRKESSSKLQRTISPTKSTGPTVAVSAEIHIHPEDDVSTLGDPMGLPGGMLLGGLDRDEQTASIGDADYDYRQDYGHGQNPGSSLSLSTRERDRLASDGNSTTLSKLGRMADTLFSDESSFEQLFSAGEERYDVVAPAGKLGMVIDTPNGGLPVVHAIKDTSVLANSVRVGDRLLSVDGEDCTAMSAMQVSKLISLKSEKPARVLVFAHRRVNNAGTAEA